MKWLTLILSLPTENATVRQRAWRALKASGAAVLRDGVYLLPANDACHATLQTIAGEVQAGGGAAFMLQASTADGSDLRPLFDRSGDYAALLAELAPLHAALSGATLAETQRQTRKLRKTFAQLAAIDFFAGEAQDQTNSALQALEQACTRIASPDEPQALDGAIEQLDPAAYHGRRWATRQRPWVDRLASAWLIRRFIDPQASILWLPGPQHCPADALGFDFDGARFSHIGNRVTFEVLLASFGLAQPALTRLGQLVHYLDVGGVQPAEAAGVASILTGLRHAIADDDALLTAASAVFDGLLADFNPTSIP